MQRPPHGRDTYASRVTICLIGSIDSSSVASSRMSEAKVGALLRARRPAFPPADIRLHDFCSLYKVLVDGVLPNAYDDNRACCAKGRPRFGSGVSGPRMRAARGRSGALASATPGARHGHAHLRRHSQNELSPSRGALHASTILQNELGGHRACVAPEHHFAKRTRRPPGACCARASFRKTNSAATGRVLHPSIISQNELAVGSPATNPDEPSDRRCAPSEDRLREIRGIGAGRAAPDFAGAHPGYTLNPFCCEFVFSISMAAGPPPPRAPH